MQEQSYGVTHFTTGNDAIHHAVVSQELRSLEAIRQVLANGLLDHPGTREADEGTGLSQVHVPSIA